MKKINLLFIILVTTIFLGCGGSSDGGGDSTLTNDTAIDDNTNNDAVSTSIPTELVGKWVYADTGEEVYLTTNSSLAYAKVDDNLLKTDTNRHLIRASIAKTKLTGKLLIPESVNMQSKRTTGYSGAAGINVILKNTNDGKVSSTTTTDSSGSFTDVSLPSGEYELFAEVDDVSVQQTITIEDEEEDLGNYVLLDDAEHNFKTEIIMNEEFLYGNSTTYSGVVRIHNISEIDGLGLSYILETTDTKVKSFSHDNVLGTITAGSYKDVPFQISFNQLLLNERKIPLSVTLRDVNYNEWTDILNFKVYRTKYRINVASEQSSVKGYITLPNNKQLSINMSNGYVEVPSLLDDDYYVVFANADLAQETAYSIGYETTTESLSSFTDTGRYEINNGTLKGAQAIVANTAISSYLHIGDIDFYKIQISDNSGLFTNINNAHLNTQYSSNEIIITDEILGYGNSVTVDSGDIVLNGISAGQTTNIQSGDKIKIVLISSEEYSTNIKAKFNIGSLAMSFNLMTYSESFIIDNTIDVFEFTNIEGGLPSTEYISNPISITGINSMIMVTATNGILIKNNVEQNSSSLTVVDGDIINVKLTTNSNFNSDSIISASVTIGAVTKSFFVKGFITHEGFDYKNVISPQTDRVWLDRNLGASRVCLSYNDSECYGDYFQWGRELDGHENLNSGVVDTLSNSITNLGNRFILSINPIKLDTSNTFISDWTTIDIDGTERSNNWSKIDGSIICPVGYRVPTKEELNNEIINNDINSSDDSMNSFLKLPFAGWYVGFNHSQGLFSEGSSLNMWTSSVNGAKSELLLMTSSKGAYFRAYDRSNGSSVRCIKDQ